MTVSYIHYWRGVGGGSGDVVMGVLSVCLDKEEEQAKCLEEDEEEGCS